MELIIMFTGFIYLKWASGAITRETISVAQAMADSPILGPKIVDSAWYITDLC
jgi:hypothetical protein